MRTLAITVLFAACGGGGETRSPHPSPASSPSPQVVLEHASQHDLATEIDDADLNGTWKALRQRWQGQHLTWTVTRYRALCGSAEQCNIAAFPIQHGTGHGATSGWMPIVKFAPGQYDAMATACGDREQCEINIEGVLSDLDAGGESATKMTLSDVKLSTKIATR